MKTFQDFDLKSYWDIILELGREKGISEEKLEIFMLDFLEKQKEQLTTKVHCLTCGVKFPLSNLQHECNEEDIWLYQYVKNSSQKNTLKKEYISKLKEKYPLKKGSIKAFRGINFQSKAEYEVFIKEVKSGIYSFKEISSWSLNHSYAERFATFIQKGTKENDNIRKQKLRNMIEQKTNMTGYKGVVLEIELTENMVLCDISEEYIGSMDEKEIILLPGVYPVSVFSEIEKKYKNYWSHKAIQLVESL